MKLGDLATRLGCVLEGPSEVEITGVAGMDEASPSEVTFLSNPKYERKLHTTRAAAIIVAPEVSLPGKPLLHSTNPYLSFAKAVEVFAPPRAAAGRHSPDGGYCSRRQTRSQPFHWPLRRHRRRLRGGDDCVLKSFVMIYRGARIGHRFLAHSHAVVRENVQIGNDVILQNGVVVGGDGFGFVPLADGSYYKIVAAGTVVIEDGVEIQANACIDRATVGTTYLRRGVKVDNLVQIGHGCDIGENSLSARKSAWLGVASLAAMSFSPARWARLAT